MNQVDRVGSFTKRHFVVVHVKNFSPVNYYDYQLSEARRVFGDEVLTSKRQCCQGQLAAFPIVTTHHVTSPAMKACQIEIASGD